MALSKKLLSTLDEETEPLFKRLKIADNAFKYVDLSIQKKEVILLKWLIKQETDDINIWQKVVEWLSSNHINTLSRNDLSEDDFHFINEEIIKQFKRTQDLDIKELIIKAMYMLIENNTFHLSYVHNLEQYFAVVNCLLNSHKSQEMIAKIMKMEFMINLGHTSKESYSALLDFIIKQLSTSLIHHETDFYTEAVEFIQKCLFNKNIRYFETYYSNIFTPEENGEIHYVPKLLFKKLKSIYKMEPQKNSFLYKLLYQAYCNCAKSDSLSMYKYFIVLLEATGFNLTGTMKLNNSASIYKVNGMELEKSLQILENLFEVLTAVNFNIEVTIADVSASTLFQNLLHYMLNMKCSIKYTNRIIDHVKILNPLIIEALINDILVYITFNVDEESQILVEQLFLSVMEVFAKLHRIQSLISKVVPFFKIKLSAEASSHDIDTFKVTFTGLEEVTSLDKTKLSARTIFPQNVLNYFTICIGQLASWQVMNLFNTFLFHLKDFLDNNIKQNDQDNLLFIELLSTLLCQFLSSVRVAEHTTATLNLKKFIKGMEELRSLLGQFGSSLLLMKHNHVLMGAFLNIAYTWAELYMIMLYYSSDEMKPNLVMDNDYSCFNIVYLHSYLSPERWSTLSQRIINFGEKPCNQTLHKLAIQKLRALLLFGNSIPEEIFLATTNELTLNLEENFELLCDSFAMKHIIPRFSDEHIKKISNNYLNIMIKQKDPQLLRRICDCNLILNGILYSTLQNLNESLKQKGEQTRIGKILNVISTEYFLSTKEDEDRISNFKMIFNTFDELLRTPTCDGDFKLKRDKLVQYLEILNTLPLAYATNYLKSTIFIYLSCLLCDLKELCAQDEDFMHLIEKILIGILQSGPILIVNVKKSSVIIDFLLKYVKRYQEMFQYIIHMMLKSEDYESDLNDGINYLIKNINGEQFFHCTLITLNELTKFKKQHVSMDHKKVLQNNQITICNSLEGLILRKETRSVEAFTAVLKFNLNRPESKLEEILRHLDYYVNLAINNLQIGFVQESLELFVTVLNNKSQIKSIDCDFAKRTWDTCKHLSVTSKAEKDLFCKFVVVTFDLISNDDFSAWAQELLRSTLKPVEDNDYNVFSTRINIWNFTLMCSFNAVKSKIWQESIQTLLQILILANIPKDETHYDQYYGSVLNLTNNLIRKTQLPLTPSIIDLSLLSVTVVMRHNIKFIDAFKTSISILESLLKCRNALIMDRLPAFLQQYRVLLGSLCEKSNSEIQIDNARLQSLSNCAHLLEKLTRNIVACEKYVARVTPYLICDILKEYETVTLYPSVKLHLNNCMYNLLKLCDQHAIAYLLRILSTASTEIFKIIYDNYKKYYRFTGKV